MIIRKEIIHNFPVMVEDIDIAEKIFGPGVYIFKVRTTIQSPKVVVDNFIEIPRELFDNNQELILCTVNGYYVHQSTGIFCNN